MTILYLLKQVGFGAIAYSDSWENIMKKYNKETDNGTYCGYSVYKVEAENYDKRGYVNGWIYLNSLKGEKCEL